jgi:hypothetical protein
MQLDVDAARAAVQTVADAMGLESAEQAAEGIVAIVNENMAGALRLVSVQRGHDPREFALVAYGGAGPLHANALASLMGSFPVIVPPAPGLLCAIGDLVADFRDEFAQTYIRLLADAGGVEVAEILDGLGTRATEWLEGEGIPADARRVIYSADMRYHRQGYEIPVALDPDEVRSTGWPISRSGSTACTSSSTASDARDRVRDRQPARGRLRVRAEARAAGRRGGRCRRLGGGRRRAPGRLRRAAGGDEDLRPLEAPARGIAGRARRSSPSSTRRRSSCPATGRKVDVNFNILITPNE